VTMHVNQSALQEAITSFEGNAAFSNRNSSLVSDLVRGLVHHGLVNEEDINRCRDQVVEAAEFRDATTATAMILGNRSLRECYRTSRALEFNAAADRRNAILADKYVLLSQTVIEIDALTASETIQQSQVSAIALRKRVFHELRKIGMTLARMVGFSLSLLLVLGRVRMVSLRHAVPQQLASWMAVLQGGRAVEQIVQDSLVEAQVIQEVEAVEQIVQESHLETQEIHEGEAVEQIFQENHVERQAIQEGGAVEQIVLAEFVEEQAIEEGGAVEQIVQ